MSTLNVDKVDPSTGTALEIGTSGDTITVPSGATLVVAGTTEITGTNNVQRHNAQPFFINGDMQVAQRGTSASNVSATAYEELYPADRCTFQTGKIGLFTAIQEALTSGAAFDAGLKMAARIDCTTADASPAAADYFWFQYQAEAQDCLSWKKGTTSATVMTLSFWVKSNKTGTAQVNLWDNDNSRIVSALYTISSGDTWEQKVVTFPMETSNPLDNNNGVGFRFEWWLGAGSDYNSGTAPTAWEAIAHADRGVNNLAINDNTANDWAIAGIQAEVGTFTSSTLPPFQFESYGENLARCHRYFLYTGGGSAYQQHGVGVEVSATAAYNTISLTCPMRASPSFEARNISSLRIYDGDGESTVTSIGSTNYSPNTSLVNTSVNASGGGLTDGNGAVTYSSNNSDSGFLISAEL